MGQLIGACKSDGLAAWQLFSQLRGEDRDAALHKLNGLIRGGVCRHVVIVANGDGRWGDNFSIGVAAHDYTVKAAEDTKLRPCPSPYRSRDVLRMRTTVRPAHAQRQHADHAQTLPPRRPGERATSPTNFLDADNLHLSQARIDARGGARLELSTPSPGDLQADALLDRMRAYAEASRATNTWRAYQSDLRHFAAWCAEHDISEPVPAAPTAVAAYLTDYAGVLSISTLQRRLYALSALHRAGHFPSPADAPEVQTVWSGIKRTHRTAPDQKAPTGTRLIAAMCATLGERPIDVRDRALLLLGFAGAFRRSELVAFNIEDLTDTDDGLRIAVRRSKADQEGEGASVGIPYGSNPATCPVRAWRAWLAVRGLTEGPAFFPIDRHERFSHRRLTTRAVAKVVKRHVAAAGHDPTLFAAHSLRAGFATEAFGQGVPEFSVMRHGRWQSASSMRGYIREGSLFHDNAAAKLGL